MNSVNRPRRDTAWTLVQRKRDLVALSMTRAVKCSRLASNTKWVLQIPLLLLFSSLTQNHCHIREPRIHTIMEKVVKVFEREKKNCFFFFSCINNFFLWVEKLLSKGLVQWKSWWSNLATIIKWQIVVFSFWSLDQK